MYSRHGFGLTIVLLASLTVILLGTGMMWSVRSLFTSDEQEKVLWEDMQQIASAVRVFAAEKHRPPMTLQELRDGGYLSPVTGTVFAQKDYVWKLEYGRVRIWIGKFDKVTLKETILHDSNGVPFRVVAEYKSPEPVVYLKTLPSSQWSVMKYVGNDVHAFSEDGHLLFTFDVTPYNGTDSRTWSVAWNPTNDLVYVCNHDDNVMQMYSPYGEFVGKWSLGYDITGNQMYIDSGGRIWVVEYYDSVTNSGVAVHSSSGSLLWRGGFLKGFI